MSTIALPHAVSARSSAGNPDFTGTRAMLRLYLRRDRIILPLWVAVLGILMPVAYAGSVRSVYRTPADLTQFANATNAAKAEVALYGPVYSPTLGAVSIWKAGVLGLVLGVAVILTVIRHTRAEEEAGRSELIDAGVVGRYAGLTAALLIAATASLASGGLFAAMLRAYHLPTAGSVAFGSALAAAGLVFTGVGGVAAQLTPSAHAARGYALGALGVAFAVRAVGDVGTGTLSWLSPLGWSILVRPYAGERWWILGLHAAFATALVALTFWLASRRDLGSGLIAERVGAAHAGPGLRGPLGVAWRLQRGIFLAWTVALLLYGLLFGSAATNMEKQLGSNTSFRDIIARLGGITSLTDTFVGLAISILAMTATAYGIAAALRLRTEAETQHAEAILSGAVPRSRWAASHLLFALAGPAIAILVGGTAAGLAYGIAEHDLAHKLPASIAGAAVQLPAVWICVGAAFALFGLVPRHAGLAWALYVGFLLVYSLGALAEFPQWARDLEPFSHLPKLPGGHFTAVPVLWELSIAVALLAVGFVALRRRDM